MAGQDSARRPHGAIDVLLVDDHAVVREGLRLVIATCTRAVHRVTEAGSVAEARSCLATTTFDVALLDVMLPDGDGIQLCREITRAHPSTASVILTAHPDRHLLIAATLAGAFGYVSKEAGAEALCRAIATAAAGERTLDNDALSHALELLAQSYTEHDLLGVLTEQERRVFVLVGQGLSNLQIAQRMHLTEKTVKNYVSRMLAKLCMDRRTEAAVLAARLAERRERDRDQARIYRDTG